MACFSLHSQGNPLTVRLFVPLWVINATQLPVTIGIIALDVQVWRARVAGCL